MRRPFYLRVLQNEKLEIVGVYDPNRAVAEDRAKRCGITAYTDYRAMIEKTRPAFVLSLNRHVRMPGPFLRFLVDSGIPFLAEKGGCCKTHEEASVGAVYDRAFFLELTKYARS